MIELSQRISFLKQSRLFDGHNHSELVQIATKLKKEVFGRHEILCKAGEASHHFFFVLHGEVLLQYFPPGDEYPKQKMSQILVPNHDNNLMLRGGSVIGEDSMVRERERERERERGSKLVLRD